MKTYSWTKGPFSVIGKAGSTEDGPGFIQQLWEAANSGFAEIEHLAKRDEAGHLVGIWGAMTDASGAFLPWQQDFTQGLYLAGVESMEDAQPPEGWTKWSVPGFTYLCAACDHDTVFQEMIAHLREQGLPLAGAVQEYTCPKTGDSYLLFPIEKQ